jgi:predicted alpha/beta hydrolase family esterase
MTSGAQNSEKPPVTVLFVPGLRDHVEDHWQTLLAREYPGSVTVPPLTENRLSLKARTDALEATLRGISGEVILVAHSAGVLITVHWAQRATRAIRGALLATPADVETPLPAGYPTFEELQANGWLPTPRTELPFPSLLAASSNDPLASFERTAALARNWKSTLVELGAVGHLNPAAGYGPWPQGKTLIDWLCQSAVPAASEAGV